MKKFVLVLTAVAAVIAIAFPILASISSGSISGQIIVVAVSEARKVPVCLVMPADYVAVPIRVISDQKNSALAYEEVRLATEFIVQKANSSGQFRTSKGVISLAQQKGGFGISSGSWNQPAASSEISLLVPLTKERVNIFVAGVEAARFIEALPLSGKVRCETGRLQLAVDNPEQYRAKLLGLIAEEIKKTQDALAPKGIVRVKGLESSVMVRQADDREVELFLVYSLSVTTGK